MKKALALVLLWVLMLSAGIQFAFAVTVPNQGHIILESIGDPETVDPAWAYDTASAGLIFHVYQTLIDFDIDSVENFVPELAVPMGSAPYKYESESSMVCMTNITVMNTTTTNIPMGNVFGSRWKHGAKNYTVTGAVDTNTDGNLSVSDFLYIQDEETGVTTYKHVASLEWEEDHWHMQLGPHSKWMTAPGPNPPDPVSSWWTDGSQVSHCYKWRDNDGSGNLTKSDWIWLEEMGTGEKRRQHITNVWTSSPVTIELEYYRYEFEIRLDPPVKFHDGDILTTEDVEYSFEHILVQDRSGGPEWMFYEPLFGRYHASMAWPEDDMTPINCAVESNATHVWFNLEMSYPPFLQILSQSWASILNKDFMIANGDWPGTWNNWKSFHNPPTAPIDVAGFKMCGTGPYKLDYWTHGVEWSIVKFDDYWEGWPAPSCSRSTDRITEKVVYEWGTRLADFRAGTADGVYVPRAYIAQVEGWSGIRGLKDMPSLTCGAIFFNFDITTPSPYTGTDTWGGGIPSDFFSDKNIRLAFTHAFDHDQFIADIFKGEAETPPTPHIKGLSYAAAVWDGVTNDIYGPLDKVPRRDINLTKVEEEMKLAFGGAVWTNGFKLTIAYNAGNVPRMTAASMFEENIEAVVPNANIDTVAVTWSTYLGEIWYYPTYRSVLPIFIIGWLADYPDPHNFVMPFQHSEGDFTYPTSYLNATVDAWIEAGIKETEDDEREKIYWDIGWSYYHDQPSIALYQPTARRWERDWVQGYYYNSIFPMTYYHHIWKGLNGDISGDNVVDIDDTALLSAHWHDPDTPGVPYIGPLGYDRIADIYPYIQYQGDVAERTLWLPPGETSVGFNQFDDWLALNDHWGETVG